MNLVLIIGIITAAGVLGGLALKHVRISRVSSYIVVGILLSPSVLGIVPEEAVESLALITQVALAVVAYLIGGSLRIESLRGLGKSITWVTILQSVGAWLVVTVVLAPLGFVLLPGEQLWQTYFPMALIIGAIASATAPAATMAVVHEYRAKGPLTTTLLALVALDDAIAVIAFSISMGVAVALVGGATDMSSQHVFVAPLWHLAESTMAGVVSAAILIGMSRLISAREVLVAAVFGVVMLCAGAAIYLDASPIFACMVLGFVVANVMHRDDAFVVTEGIEEPLYAMFFVLAGLHFDVAVMRTAGLLAGLIVVVRCIGKYGGARLGAEISGAAESVKKYLGLTLLPQAGVAIGLALLAAPRFPSFGDVLLNGVMASVVVNALIAPSLTKLALFKAGEATTSGS